MFINSVPSSCISHTDVSLMYSPLSLAFLSASAIAFSAALREVKIRVKWKSPCYTSAVYIFIVDFVSLMIVLFYFGKYWFNWTSVGCHKSIGQFLDIVIRRCELYAILFIITEGYPIRHQYKCYFVLDALRLPFFKFVVAHNLKFVKSAVFSYLWPLVPTGTRCKDKDKILTTKIKWQLF